MNSEKSVFQVVSETIFEKKMINKGDRILAAVSGGADSVCMLHVLNRLKSIIGFDIYCAHLNHNLRGEAADADEKFVIELCGRLGIPVFTKSVDVEALAKEKKMTLEEAGRFARYEFFDELSQRYRITKTATAHNKNDNAETVLMRILRGTGIDGLGGISYEREDSVIRPLLDVSRFEIEVYCKENNLDFCTDATNSDNDYTRNKIRNKLIPYLEEEFNNKVMDSLCRLADNAKEDSEFLNSYARRLYDRLKSPLPQGNPIALHIESLCMADKAIIARVIRIAADEAQKGVHLEKKHIDDIFDLLKKETGAELSLPDGLKARIQYGWLAFETDCAEKTVVAEGDAFFTELSVPEKVFVDLLGRTISFRVETKDYKCKVNEVGLSYDLISGSKLFLRSRRSGDKMVYFADGRTKKIKNILIDAKVPRQDRERIPLLCTGSEVLAIVGGRVSEKYKVTKETERILVVEYEGA